jgi:ribosomal protein S6E (S10)
MSNPKESNMSKHEVDEKEYARLVNHKMKEHEFYKEGMEAELYPDSSEKPSGLNIVGGIEARGISVWAEVQIKNEYQLVITR